MSCFDWTILDGDDDDDEDVARRPRAYINR
jgi:hypothetical protein